MPTIDEGGQMKLHDGPCPEVLATLNAEVARWYAARSGGDARSRDGDR
jgi:hypothetical protein